MAQILEMSPAIAATTGVLFVGLGIGLMYTPSVVILGLYFEKHRNMAFGFVSTGVGVGTLVFALMTQDLIRYLGWRVTMLALAGIMSVNFVIAALMRPFKHAPVEPIVAEVTFEAIEKALEAQHDTKDIGLNDVINSIQSISQQYEDIIASMNNTASNSGDALSEPPHNLPEVTPTFKTARRESVMLIIETKPDPPKSFTSVYLNALFLSYMASLATVCVGYLCVYTHFPAYVLANGSSESQASQCVSMMGLGNIVGRLAVGGLANKWTNHVSHMILMSCVITAAVMLSAPLVGGSFAAQAAVSFLFGMFGNIFVPLMAPMCIETVGVAHLNLAYGISIVLCGIGSAVGPPIAGMTS